MPRCTASSVRIDEYSTLAGTGNVNDLFRITDVSDRFCSLHGFVRVSFVGVYGYGNEPLQNAHALSVEQVESRGRVGNDFGGLAPGLPVPTVIFSSMKIAASFWVYGVDISTTQSNGVSSRCITSFEMRLQLAGEAKSFVVRPAPNSGFFWCGSVFADPIVSGCSGSDPAKALLFHFN